MKQRMLSLLLVLTLALSLAVSAGAARTMSFTDVRSSDWFYSYVKDLYGSGIVDGTTPTTFSPQGTVTLAQALKLLLRATGVAEQAPTTSHWASGYYTYAEKHGLLPASGTTLTLDKPVTRLQIAEMAQAALKLSRTQTVKPFADTTSTAVLALYDAGILQGSKDSSGRILFHPQDSITRAEISAVVWRIEDYTEKQSATPTTPTTPTETDQDEGKPYFLFYGKKIYIDESVPKNEYDKALFSYNDDGFLVYDGDDYLCKVGIDVSRHQGSIDWAAVKDAGVDFAMLRLGYRGYGTGAIVTDSYFAQNIRDALANGIEVGVYFFSQAISPAEAVEEAQYCMDVLADYDITYPVVFDWEPYDASTVPDARTHGLSDEVLNACAIAFCDAIEAGGYQSMIYGNLTYFYRHYDLSKLLDYPLWLAQYNSTPTFYYHFDMWQYSSKGSVAGIDGNVDLDLYLIPKK